MSVYLNNAATSWPKPPCVIQAMTDFLTSDGANLSRGAASARDIETMDIVLSCREKLAALFGGYKDNDPRYVTFTQNVTESINVVLKGFLKPGMRVVTSSMEHNSVIRPLRALEATGVAVEIVGCSPHGFLDVDDLEPAVARGADVVVISHASNVCGAIQNLGAIAEVCSSYGAPLVVDAAQSAGVLDIDVEKLRVAALCFTGHKSLMGPPGIGGIVWKPDFAERVSPLIEGGTGSFSHEEYQPSVLPDKFESGTPNLPGIAGLNAALAWIAETGTDVIRAREDDLGARFINAISKIDEITIHGPRYGMSRLPLYALNFDVIDNATAADILSERFGIETRPGLHCSPLAHITLGTYPQGALRISPGYFNTEQDIDATIEALTVIAEEE